MHVKHFIIYLKTEILKAVLILLLLEVKVLERQQEKTLFIMILYYHLRRFSTCCMAAELCFIIIIHSIFFLSSRQATLISSVKLWTWDSFNLNFISHCVRAMRKLLSWILLHLMRQKKDHFSVLNISSSLF